MFMCYQTRQIRTVKDLELRFNVGLINESYRTGFDQPAFHLNGFAHPNMLVIPQDKPSALVPGVWGIVPDNKQSDQVRDYYKEAIRYGSGLNARSEKLFQHYVYREVALTQRCLIPVTGFFEPHTHLKKKYPYYIHRQDDSSFALAGIYTVIDTYITFTILTKAATPLFERIHNLKKRQPVLVPRDVESSWLDPELSRSEIEDIIHITYPEKELETYTISKDLYNPKVDSNVDSIVNKVNYPELQDGISGSLFG